MRSENSLTCKASKVFLYLLQYVLWKPDADGIH